MKKHKFTIPTTIALFLGTLVSIVGCGAPNEPTSTPKVNPDAIAQLQGIFSPVPSKDAMSVLEARKTAQAGQSITVVGRVGGIKRPFSENFASLVLTDDTTETCERIPGDGCKTPWDACCVGSKTLAASRMTIQVSDEQGLPLEHPIQGVQGLKELDRLIIQGEVASTSNKDNLILNATRIEIK